MNQTALFDNAIPLKPKVIKDDITQDQLEHLKNLCSFSKHIYTQQLKSGRWQAVCIFKEVFRDPLKAGGASEKKAFSLLTTKLRREYLMTFSKEDKAVLGIK